MTSGGSTPNGPVRRRIRLYDDSRERSEIENLADLYSLIMTTEHLETAYVRSSISEDDYSRECTKLIAQFKTQLAACESLIQSPQAFLAKYRVQAPAAVKRLLEYGVPATAIHKHANPKASQSAVAAKAVHHFITALDAIKLGERAKDSLHPLMQDLMEALNKACDENHEARIKVREWFQKLHHMKASDELSDDDARQFAFDLEHAYNEFHKSLEAD